MRYVSCSGVDPGSVKEGLSGFIQWWKASGRYVETQRTPWIHQCCCWGITYYPI